MDENRRAIRHHPSVKSRVYLPGDTSGALRPSRLVAYALRTRLVYLLAFMYLRSHQPLLIIVTVLSVMIAADFSWVASVV